MGSNFAELETRRTICVFKELYASSMEPFSTQEAGSYGR
jgi:hypothetical protein